jgi:hypothetical protein
MRKGILSMVAAMLSITSPAGAENGMKKGYGPCWAIATEEERKIMRTESRGWPTADNPTSTAFGCGQLIAANRRRHAKRCATHPDTVNAAAQMCMFREYIRTRYGSTTRALYVKRAQGTY